jgi:colicin import membrane protein
MRPSDIRYKARRTDAFSGAGIVITRRIVLIVLIACFLQAAMVRTGTAQKNSRSRQQDERRENQRVAQAEKHLKQVQKELADARKQLREHSQAALAAAEAAQAAKTKLNAAKEAAEDRLAESLGIGSALENLKAARARLKAIAEPIVQSLHRSDAWQKTRSAADQALTERDRIEEDLALSDQQRTAQLQQLRELIQKPYELELEAVAADAEGKRASDAVEAASEAVNKIRRAISPEKVAQDAQVRSAGEALKQAEAEQQAAAKRLAATRTAASKVQAQLLTAQSSLAQARRADAADPNRPQPRRPK